MAVPNNGRRTFTTLRHESACPSVSMVSCRGTVTRLKLHWEIQLGPCILPAGRGEEDIRTRIYTIQEDREGPRTYNHARGRFKPKSVHTRI